MNKSAKTTYYLGAFVLVILTSSVYFMLQDNVKIDVQKTLTQFYVWQDNDWQLGATEYLNLFDGTVKMRAKTRDITQTVTGSTVTVVRTSYWKDNITTMHTYTFDTSTDNIEKIPLKSTLQCINCKGKIVHFEYRDISYDGITREAVSPEEFGNRMKVEWQDGAYYSKLFQQKVASDKLIIRYKPETDNIIYEVRMFDPPIATDMFNMSFNGYYADTKYELETKTTIDFETNYSLNSSEYYIICLDSSDVLKGNNFTCIYGINDSMTCLQEYSTQGSYCSFNVNSNGYSSSGGTWSIPASVAYDGNYNSFAQLSSPYSGYIYFNYSIPKQATNESLWQVKDESGTVNLTIPTDCWEAYNNNFLYLSVHGTFAFANWMCYNTTHWKTLRKIYPAVGYKIYEESMFWKYVGNEYNYSQHNISVGKFTNGLNYIDSSFNKVYVNLTLSDGESFVYNNDNYTMPDAIENFTSNFTAVGVTWCYDGTSWRFYSGGAPDTLKYIEKGWECLFNLLDDNGTIDYYNVGGYSSDFKIELNYSVITDIEYVKLSLSSNGTINSTFSLEYLNNSETFPGGMYNKRSNITTFNDGKKSELLLFSSPSTITRYVNLSTNNIEGLTDINMTFFILGDEIDNETVNFKELFYNDTSIESYTGTVPVIYDDYSAGEKSGRWVDSGSFTLSITDNVSVQNVGGANGGGTCNSGWTTQKKTGTFYSGDYDISQSQELKLRVEIISLANCVTSNCPQGTEARSTATFGLRDDLGNVHIIDTVSSSTGKCDYVGDADTDEIDTTYTIQFRDDGFIWVNGVKEVAFSNSRQYYLYGTGLVVSYGYKASSRSTVRFYEINRSGFTSQYNGSLIYDVYTQYQLISSQLSNPLTNISRATPTVRTTGSGTYTIYLSNDNGTTWEQSLSGINHIFSSTGGYIKVQINVTSTDEYDPLIIEDYSVTVTPSTTENVSIDVGNDGIIDYNYTNILNSTNSPQYVNLDSSSFRSYLGSDVCNNLKVCTVPIGFSVDKAGSLSYENITFGQSLDNILLNVTAFNKYNNNMLRNITLNISSEISSESLNSLIINISDLVVSYKGDGKINITANFYDSAFNYLSSVSRNILYRYSLFNITYPSNVNTYDVFFQTNNDKLVEPYGQKDGIGIFNVTTTAKTDSVDVIACLNETFDSCITVTWSENYNKSYSSSIGNTYNCTSYINITDGLTSSQYKYIYNWWNITNCTSDAFEFLQYNIIWDSWCNDCVRVD